MDVPLFAEGDPLPYAGDVAIPVSWHSDRFAENYCARLPAGSALKRDATRFKAKDAPAPSACSPSGAFLDEAS